MKLKNPTFTEQEEMLICQEYTDGLSTMKLAKKYNCLSWHKIRCILKKHHITCRDRDHQSTLYTINENYFDQIDCEEKAYFLGFLFADGGNIQKSVVLALKRSDEEILHRLNALFQNKPVKRYAHSTCEYSRLDICNKHMVKRLTECGVIPRKSLVLEFPSEEIVPIHLIQHFIRGYYDGDGGLVINYNQDRGKGNWTMVSTENFLKSVQYYIKLFSDANSQIMQIKTLVSTNIFTKRLVSCGNNQILKILDWLYKDATIYLQRKFDKFKELENIQNTKPRKRNHTLLL